MNHVAILEKLGLMYEGDLQTLFKAILNSQLPSEYILGEAKALNEFKLTIIKNSFEVRTLKEYAQLVGCEGEFKTLQEIQDHAENELDLCLWDYPLEEYDHAKSACNKLVLVNTDFGLRLCEL